MCGRDPLHTTVTVLPGGFYDVDLRPDRVLDFKVTSQDLGHNEVALRISAEGAGRHTFTIRSDNLALTEPAQQEINLTSARCPTSSSGTPMWSRRTRLGWRW